MKKKSTVFLVEKAVEKSNSALELFTSTVEQLRLANAELASARQQDLELIQQIKENVDSASEQEEKNNNLIVRINNIIGG